jgi:hypothetical protein
MDTKNKYYPEFRVGDPVRQVTENGFTERIGKIVDVLQGTEDFTKFTYMVRWLNGVVESLDMDSDIVDNTVERTITFMLNGEIDELRSIYPSGLPDNLNLDALIEEFETVFFGMKKYLEHYYRFRTIDDLRNFILGLKETPISEPPPEKSQNKRSNLLTKARKSGILGVVHGGKKREP